MPPQQKRPANNLCFRVTVKILAGLLLTCGSARAEPILEATFLTRVSLGSGLSGLPRDARSEGYELSGGERVSFNDWYRVQAPDLRVDFLTELTPEFGLLWGVGTGEWGKKYRIEPSLRVGFLYSTAVGGNGTFSFSLTTRLGGRLRELPCAADYGEIGGVQRVNCRLAATPLEPRETLQYLWGEKPADRVEATMRLFFRF